MPLLLKRKISFAKDVAGAVSRDVFLWWHGLQSVISSHQLASQGNPRLKSVPLRRKTLALIADPVVKLGRYKIRPVHCLLASVMTANKAAKPPSLDPADVVPAFPTRVFPDQ